MVLGLVLSALCVGHVRGESVGARRPERAHQQALLVAAEAGAGQRLADAAATAIGEPPSSGLGRHSRAVAGSPDSPVSAATTTTYAEHLFEVIRAVQIVFPLEQQRSAIAIALCESGADPTSRIIDVDGLPRAGAWHVGEQWWGPVSSDPVEQAQQVMRIFADHQWKPWSCSYVLQVIVSNYADGPRS